MLDDILYFFVVRDVEGERSRRIWEVFGEGLKPLETPTSHSERE
jgi:hypothetical protein